MVESIGDPSLLKQLTSAASVLNDAALTFQEAGENDVSTQLYDMVRDVQALFRRYPASEKIDIIDLRR